MLLTVDVGNTNTVLGLFDKERLVQSWRVKTDPRDTADELWLLYRSLIDGFELTGLAVCSTVPAVLRELDRKSTRLNSSHIPLSRMPSSA